MERQDLAPGLEVGQVDEEELVEAAAPQQLGRQPGHVVGGGHHEDRPLPLLQPGGEGAEQPRRPRLAPLPRRAPGEALLDLVDPERHRRDGLGRLQRRGQALLGPVAAPARAAGRAGPAGRRSCAAATLAASDLPQPCTPTSSTPRGAGRPKPAASGAKAWARSSSQALKLERPPRCVGRLDRLHHLEAEVAGEQPPLLLEDRGGRVVAERLVLPQGPREGPPGLPLGEAAGRGQDAVARAVASGSGASAACWTWSSTAASSVHRGERQPQRGHRLGQPVGQLQPRRHDHQAAPLGGQARQGVADGAGHRRVAEREVEVEQHRQQRPGRGQQRVERLDRASGRAGPAAPAPGARTRWRTGHRTPRRRRAPAPRPAPPRW